MLNTYNQVVDIDFPSLVASCNVPPGLSDEHGLAIFNMDATWKLLFEKQEKTITTTLLKPFMATLGTNKSGSKNGVGRNQFFMNAFSAEGPLQAANPRTFSFVGDDHFALFRGSTGSDDPDFFFRPSNGQTYTIEVKVNFSIEDYLARRPSTNFHKADYCIVFILNTSDWLISRKVDNYCNLTLASAFEATDPWLKEINFPKKYWRVRYSLPNDTRRLTTVTDAEVPDIITYEIIQHEVQVFRSSYYDQ